MDALTKERDAHKQAIISLMGTAEMATVGDYVVTYKNVNRKEYLVEAKSYRLFKMKGA